MLALARAGWHCPVVAVGRGPLTDRDVRILDFERNFVLADRERPKRVAIQQDLGLSPSRYYAILRELSGSDAAYSYDPLNVARLRRRAYDTRRRHFVNEPTRHRHPR
jgi:hypothetical protein